MASKGRKTPSLSSTPVPTPSSAAAAAAAASSSTRPASPLSPTRHSRLTEKADLQNLNDRLATYIDKIRYLEAENSRLSVEIQSSRDTVTRETCSIKHMYETELSDARKLLDETAREKAKLEIDLKRLWEQLNELQQRLNKRTDDLAAAESSARANETRLNDLSTKYNGACAERKKAQDVAKENEKENASLRKQLDELRKNLEVETLTRVDLENTVQSLREELTFQEQIHSKELTETRSRRQVDITEIDGRLAEQYEAKLQQSLQELRDQYEGQMRANREEIETLYDSKIKSLQLSSTRNAKSAASAIEELRILKSKNDSRLSELESLNSNLQSRLRDLEVQLDSERSQRAADEVELARLREEMALQLQEYQDLMDIKVSLDLEIATYDKLLSGEEERLNITPSNLASAAQLSKSFSRSGRATPLGRRLAGGKRKRTAIEESEERSLSDFSVTSTAKGDIEIIEADADGKFVKVHNKGAKEHQLGGWQLIRVAGTNETAFRFHRTVKIDANATVTVWSSDSGATHEPPSNIVMKQQKWFVADNMQTKLLNVDGEEVAASERVRQQISSRALRHRESFGTNGEELYHQQVRPAPTTSTFGRLISFW